MVFGPSTTNEDARDGAVSSTWRPASIAALRHSCASEMTSLPRLYGACKVPSLFRKRENEGRSLNIRRCSARVGNYSRTTVLGGLLPSDDAPERPVSASEPSSDAFAGMV